MPNYITGTEYDLARKEVENYINAGKSWSEIKSLNGVDFDSWNAEKAKLRYANWKEISKQEWEAIVDAMEENEKRAQEFSVKDSGNQLTDDDSLNGSQIPENESSSWMLYKDTLLSKGFSPESVDHIENQVISILRNLGRQTEPENPKKGLVIGNVQSGKTANMAGLMAMAADNGWNFFIVLTGPTDSLKEQTASRLNEDLAESDSNLEWNELSYAQMGEKNFPYKRLGKEGKVYYTVCLKNSKRLRLLIRFLHKVPNPSKLRILIIDDEADQASINTADISKKERTAINNLIVRLVYGENQNGSETRDFGAVNYVSYTATPYANCLNEQDEPGKHTLYPKNFISRLNSSRSYFGPVTIFGLPGADITDRMNIVNFIPGDDVLMVKSIEDGKSLKIPESLQKAVLWFLCAAAVQRSRDYHKPVSMLVHTSHKVEAQSMVYDALSEWLKKENTGLIEECRKVYEEEKGQFTLEDLRQTYPDYENLDKVLPDPDFEQLIPHLKTLLSQITSIKLIDTEEKEPTWNDGVLICVDNSSNNRSDEEGNFLRLIYPDREQLEKLDYAPVFLVIGGNTLSRGLTLEGLVSSYFLRSSIQADSLMQMGRWFGYRRGYELLPRIWMTENTFTKFQFLVELDEDLRNQIDEMSQLGQTPSDFGLSFINSPKANWLRLTAKNKSQSAQTVNLDYAGSDMQMVIYPTDPDIQKKNNEIVTGFLNSLGQPVLSEADGTSGIWNDVPFEKIYSDLFKKGFTVSESSRTFRDIESIREWVSKVSETEKFTDWTVILAGKQPSDDPDKNFRLDCDFSVGKVNRSAVSGDSSKVNIKVLTDKTDYLAHLRKEDFSGKNSDQWTWENLKKEKRMMLNYRNYLHAADKEHTPLLLIYCVDKNSRPLKKSRNPESQTRKPLSDFNIIEDFFGLAMVIPGVRGKKTVRVRIARNNNEFEDEENED